jgi:hypothetical protein
MLNTLATIFVYLPYVPYAVGALVVAAAVAYFLKRNSFKPYKGPEPVSNEKASAKSLSLYGDSISISSALQYLLPDVAFTNWAVAGSKLVDMVSNTPPGNLQSLGVQLRADASAVLLCRYGRNDAAFSTDPAIFRTLLQAFVSIARDTGKVPVLCSLAQELFTDRKAKRRWLEINDTIKMVASTMGVHFIDLSAVPFVPAELPDNVHPNGPYSTRMDTFIQKFLIDKRIFPA